jgi:GNAT superfamily N-acetyltransferase
MLKDFKILEATENDIPVILDFIKKLAEYENLSHEVTASETLLKKSIFGKNSNINALIGYYKNTPVGFALFFYNFSTFLGKKGIYLEDLFVLPEMRGKGFGKAFLKHIAGIAVKEDCGRFEWAVLDWNEPSRKFYESLGAKPMTEWIIHRLTGDELKRLSE